MDTSAGTFCRGCGYHLGGLGAGKCPECGRAFDPGDPGTFDRLPRRTRRRRLLRRVLLVVAVLAMVLAFAPRGYVQGQLTMVNAGGGATEVARIQLMAPAWLVRLIGARYPGWTWRRAVPAPPLGATMAFDARGFRLTLRGWESLGNSTAWSQSTPAGQTTLNGKAATPQSADAIFETVLPDFAAQRGFSVRVGTITGDQAATGPR